MAAGLLNSAWHQVPRELASVATGLLDSTWHQFPRELVLVTTEANPPRGLSSMLGAAMPFWGRPAVAENLLAGLTKAEEGKVPLELPLGLTAVALFWKQASVTQFSRGRPTLWKMVSRASGLTE